MQKNAVWMLKMNGGGIIDHEVGTGKTMIMCVARGMVHDDRLKRTYSYIFPALISESIST